MSLSRVLIMDLFTRYPDAATIEEAVDLHSRALKVMVEAKWAELAAAEKALTEFQSATGGKRDAVPARAPEPPAVAPTEKAVQQQAAVPSYRRKMTKPFTRRRLLPPSNESRPRAGSDVLEYRYVSGEYIALAASVPMGTPEGDDAVWLSDKEIDSIREVVRNRKAQRDERR